jgi:hypothetical protein
MRRPVLDGADQHAFDRGAADERDHERDGKGRPEREPVVHQGPGHVGRERRHLALREIEHVRGPVDEHQREREARVDRALGEPAHDLLHEVGQQYPR